MHMKTYTRRRRSGVFFGVLLLWSWSAGVCTARAQPNTAPALELSRLLREALERNADIQAARQRWDAAKAVIPQVKTLPDPMLNFGYEKVLDRE